MNSFHAIMISQEIVKNLSTVLLLLLPLLLSKGVHVSAKVYTIVPTHIPSYKCLDDSCLTLSQFAQNSINYIALSTTLIITGEYHGLDVGLAVFNVAEFVMLSTNNTNHTSYPVITCSKSAKFTFTNVSTIHFNGLKFERCNTGRFQLIHKLTIENSTFINSQSPITLSYSNVSLIGTKFYFNLGNYINGSNLLQRLAEHTDQVLKASLGGALMVTCSTIAIENCDFVGNTANFGGAIFSEVNSNITIIDSKFTDNHAKDCISGLCAGGAVLIDMGGMMFVSNTTFFNNTSSLDGGVAAIINATLLLSHSCVHMNTASGSGGAVATSKDSNLILESTHLFDNKAEKDGGAVYLHEGNTTISNCEISSNNAEGNGGAICALHTSSIEVNNSILKNNQAQEGNGGALYGEHKSLVTVSNCSFINNTAQNGGVVRINLNSAVCIEGSNFSGNNASIDGGVAFAYNKSMVSIKDCNLVNNWADDFGGAVRIEKNCTANIIDCNFAGNRADYGGALEVNDRSNVSIASCNFSRNMATNKGAVLQAYFNCAAAISSSNFIQNKAGDQGGAVYGRRNCTISIRDSIFFKNTAEYSGGGVYIGHDSTVHIDNCTFLNSTADFGAAVVAYVRTAVNITSSSFNQNRAAVEGGALHAYRYSSIAVQSSKFTLNKARSGGSCLALFDCRLTFQDVTFFNSSADFGGVIGLLVGNTITIIGCTFAHNNALQSGGVLYAQHSKVVVKKHTTFKLNSANLFGGVIHATDNCTIIISTITFINNTADDGGVLSLLDNSVGLIKHSDFISNQANESGGAIYINKARIGVSCSRFNLSNANRRGGVMSASTMSEVYVTGSNFSCSKAKVGAALTIEENSILSFNFHHDLHQLGINDSDICESSDSSLIYNNTALKLGGGIYLSESSLYIWIETNVSFNTARVLGGGIHAVHSSITVKTTVHFVSNTAASGGALSLRNSNFYDMINEDVMAYMIFVSNQADYGGALYVNFNDDDENVTDVCFGEYSSTSGCFFQNVSDAFMINFDNNHAKYGGDDLFGGLLDRCTVVNSADHSVWEPNGVARFKTISNMTNTSLKSVSSKPVRVCFCENSQPNCSERSKYVQVKHRGTILLSLAAVDQVNNLAKATIKSRIQDLNFLSENQATQTIGAACSSLKYYIKAYPRAIPYETTVYADGPCSDKGISKLTVNINVVPCTCAPGFEVDVDNEVCKCNCDRRLLDYINYCDPETVSVKREGVFWITIIDKNDGNFSYLIFPYCPMDYCQSPSKSIPVNLNKLNGSDAQCANNHSGLLCGKCQPNYSLSLGSSKCIQCYKEWTGQLIGITVAALFAGIFIVAIVLVLNLTVAIGTLNSIILYANIVYSNRILRQSQFSSVFISWLNLDIGFDVCFYEGMDAYTKTWLELAFPAYIIFLVVATIWISSRSSTFSNLIGKRNPVATLATLILISYTKFLQTIIIIFSFVKSNSSITPATRWLYDASIVYFGWKHALLFFTAVLVLIFGLFYTIILFSWQWLLHCPRSKIFSWTRNQKLHSFIDTYHTPHTAKHRYWTGLLLLVRVILYLIAAFSASVYADPHIPLLATIVAMWCLILFKTVMMIKVYRNWLLNAMDSLLCFNVVIPAIFTLHSFTDKSLPTKVTNISVGITAILLCSIIAFHVYRYSSVKLHTYCQNTRFCECMTRWLLFIQSQEKSSSIPSDGRLLDVLDSLRQDDDKICDQQDEPTTSIVSLVHSVESPTSDSNIKFYVEENQSEYQLHSDKGTMKLQERAMFASAQRGDDTKKYEISSYCSQNQCIRKPLLDDSL